MLGEHTSRPQATAVIWVCAPSGRSPRGGYKHPLRGHVSEVWSLAGATKADTGSEGPNRLTHRCVHRECGIKWAWLDKVGAWGVELGGDRQASKSLVYPV